MLDIVDARCNHEVDLGPFGPQNVVIRVFSYVYIQGVTGGTDQTSGGCFLC